MSSIMKVAIPAAACVLALMAAPAQATLIGDTVSVEYHFPDLGTIFESDLTVVEAGPGDIVDFFTGAHQVDGAKTAMGHAYGGGAQYFAMWVVSSEL